MNTLLILFVLSATGRFELDGMYTDLKKYKVAVLDQDRIFIADTSKSTIMILTSNGEIRKKFGGRGQGPGEFRLISSICEVDGKMVAYDGMQKSLTWFDQEGNFLKSRHNQDLDVSLAYLIPNGIISIDYSYGLEKDATINIFDQDLQHKTILYKWITKWASADKPQPAFNYPAAINPAREWLFFNVADSGKLGFLVHPGPVLKVSIFDLVKRKLIKERVLKEKPLPFNKEWGEARIERQNNLPDMGPYKLKLDAPGVFPIVRNVCAAPGDKLIIELWAPNIDHKRKAIVLDNNGLYSSLPYDAVQGQRVLFIKNSIAYINQVENEQSYLIICPETEVDEVLKKYPSNYESMLSVMIKRN